MFDSACDRRDEDGRSDPGQRDSGRGEGEGAQVQPVAHGRGGDHDRHDGRGRHSAGEEPVRLPGVRGSARSIQATSTCPMSQQATAALDAATAAMSWVTQNTVVTQAVSAMAVARMARCSLPSRKRARGLRGGRRIAPG